VRRFFAVIGAGLCLAASPVQDRRPVREPLAPSDAARFAAKWAGVVARGDVPAARRRLSVQTTLTETEFNAYLRFTAKDAIPAGIVNPYVFALGNGRLAGEATVDLDAVRLSRPRGVFDFAQLLRGQVAVTVVCVLRSERGAARLDLESATAGGFALPKPLLQELVSFYTRSASNPAGVSLDAPFALPSGIREIAVQVRKAVITQ